MLGASRRSEEEDQATWSDNSTHLKPRQPKKLHVFKCLARNYEIGAAARNWVPIGLVHDNVDTWSLLHIDANIPPRWEEVAVRPIHVHTSDIDNCSDIGGVTRQQVLDVTK
jgi:hypothetical protein